MVRCPSPKSAVKRRSDRGFSLVELLVSVIILVILAAIAVPTLLRAYHSYQLGDAASRLSGMMKTTRFSAIQRNTVISCYIQQSGSTWAIWTDLNNDTAEETNEPQLTIGGVVQMLAAGAVPPPTEIVTAIGASSPSYHVVSPSSAIVKFDQRGARRFVVSETVDVFYLGNPAISDMGYRAVVVLPAGSVQVWASAPGGTWQRIS